MSAINPDEIISILKEEIEKRLPKWEAQTGLKCDSWQTKYMVTNRAPVVTDKKKLWFNLQLAQKPYACLDYIILHELTHLLTRKHDATFIAHMDKCMPNWREFVKNSMTAGWTTMKHRMKAHCRN